MQNGQEASVAVPGWRNGGAVITSPTSTGAYELLLCFNDGREELRLADHLDLFANDPHTLEFRKQQWRITATESPSQAGFTARLVCEPVRSLPSWSAADPTMPPTR